MSTNCENICNEFLSLAQQVITEPKSVLEALEQRLKVFKEREEAAKKEDDGGKVRRNGRIVKQYQDAIKLHKAGKPIPVDELPTPPGTYLIIRLTVRNESI